MTQTSIGTDLFLMLWQDVIGFVPQLVAAVVVFIIGLFIASMIARFVRKIVKMTHVDRTLARTKTWEQLSTSNVKVSIAGLIAGIVRWFIIFTFLMATTNMLGLGQVSDFLQSILAYIPQLVVAVIILAVSFIVANFVQNVVQASATAAQIAHAGTIAAIAQWAVIIFGLFATLLQLGVAEELISTLFMGIVAAISLALGLAFGLGGKDEAARALRNARERIVQK